MEVKPSGRAIRQLPPHIKAHSVRESCRAMRISSGNLEVAVVAKADLDAAGTHYHALVLELENMRILLNL